MVAQKPESLTQNGLTITLLHMLTRRQEKAVPPTKNDKMRRKELPQHLVPLGMCRNIKRGYSNLMEMQHLPDERKHPSNK